MPNKSGIGVYLIFGHYVSITRGDTELAKTAAYAEIYWGRGDYSGAESAEWHENFPSETEAKAELHELLEKVKSDALGKLNGDLRAALQLFNIPRG